MPKKSEKNPFVAGYNVWSRRRTIDEAKNIARWAPWTAHEWMEESIQGASIDEFEILERHDQAADEINAMWRRRSKHYYYDEKEFWGGVPPKMIPKCLSNNEYDIIRNEEE
tara:strand:+ start:201 stop:533 length:333 start_codon:yes stop_codon:yes gene_type:complete